jgi:hypothetical protein
MLFPEQVRNVTESTQLEPCPWEQPVGTMVGHVHAAVGNTPVQVLGDGQGVREITARQLSAV